MPIRSIALRAAVLAAATLMLSGCLAMTVASAAGTVVGTAVGVTAKVVVVGAKGAGAVVGAVLPGGKKDDKTGG